MSFAAIHSGVSIGAILHRSFEGQARFCKWGKMKAALGVWSSCIGRVTGPFFESVREDASDQFPVYIVDALSERPRGNEHIISFGVR